MLESRGDQSRTDRNAVKKPCQQRSRDSLERILKSRRGPHQSQGLRGSHHRRGRAPVAHLHRHPLRPLRGQDGAPPCHSGAGARPRGGASCRPAWPRSTGTDCRFEETVRKLVAIKSVAKRQREAVRGLRGVTAPPTAWSRQGLSAQGASKRTWRWRSSSSMRTRSASERAEEPPASPPGCGRRRRKRTCSAPCRAWLLPGGVPQDAPHERDGRRHHRLPAGTASGGAVQPAPLGRADPVRPHTGEYLSTDCGPDPDSDGKLQR